MVKVIRNETGDKLELTVTYDEMERAFAEEGSFASPAGWLKVFAKEGVDFSKPHSGVSRDSSDYSI